MCVRNTKQLFVFSSGCTELLLTYNDMQDTYKHYIL